MKTGRLGPSASVLLIVFGIVVVLLVDGGPPARERLAEARGELRALEKSASKSGGVSAVRFSLGMDGRRFQYLSKAGEAGAVFDALSRAERSEVIVLADATNEVYEIRVGPKTLRPYDEVAKAWRADEQLGRWLAHGSILFGAALLIVHWARRK